MSHLISADKARDYSIRNNPNLSTTEALRWLNNLIEDVCLEGGFELSMDIQLWHVGTYGQGYEVKNILGNMGYKFTEKDYIHIIDGIERKEKKVIINW